MRTAALLLVAPAVHAFVPSTAPAVRLAPLQVAPIGRCARDAVTAKVISAELQEMLDREWIEQDCHVVIGQNAADAYLGARAKGLDDVGSILQHVGEVMTTDFPVDAYVGPWDWLTGRRRAASEKGAVLVDPRRRAGSARRGVRRT